MDFISKPQSCNTAIKELAVDPSCEETLQNWENMTVVVSIPANTEL